MLMQKRFRVVAVGGTFDELHKGHKALLSKAFGVGDQVIIGLTSDDFVDRMAKPHITASYKERMKELESFLSDQGLLQRAKVIPIDDACGALLLSNSPIEALVVSKETESTALKINDSDPQILYRLGLSYYAFEKFKKCIKTLKGSLLNKPYHSYEADIYYHIGLAYCNQEKFEKAIYPFSVVRNSNSQDSII